MAELTLSRRNELMELVIREGKIQTAEQAQRYGVSTETIRKDLLYLESIGLVKKAYGGAVLAAECPERAFTEKVMERPEVKLRIARKAWEMIPNGSTVILDLGSTVCALTDFVNLKEKQLSFYTNSLRAAQKLIDLGCDVTIFGGSLRTSSNAVTGAWVLRQLSLLHADIAILGASGFDAHGGYVESMEEAEVKRSMIEASDRVFLLADASKEGQHALAKFCSWDAVDVLISDSPKAAKYAEAVII